MENRINIGEMDTLVQLYSVTMEKGNQGQLSKVRTLHSSVFAKVERDVGETVADYNLEQGDSIRLTVYKVPSLTTRWEVKVGGVMYGISSIDHVSRTSPLCILTLRTMD